MGRSVGPRPGSGKRPLRAGARWATLRRMRILVSNDDGVEASGLRALSEALLEGRFQPGDTVRIDIQNDEIVIINVSEPALA